MFAPPLAVVVLAALLISLLLKTANSEGVSYISVGCTLNNLHLENDKHTLTFDRITLLCNDLMLQKYIYLNDVPVNVSTIEFKNNNLTGVDERTLTGRMTDDHGDIDLDVSNNSYFLPFASTFPFTKIIVQNTNIGVKAGCYTLEGKDLIKKKSNNEKLPTLFNLNFKLR